MLAPVTLEDVPDADEKCVNEKLSAGGKTGKWSPVNNCNTLADQILCSCKSKRCTIDPYNFPGKPGGYK